MATSSAVASNSSAYLQCPPSYSRSRSSGSSASSLSSTFSDLTSSTSAYSSSPPASKTNAFFASPFSTRPPTPSLPTAPPPPQPRSLTADFFATPVRTPSPPSSLRAAGTRENTIHPSRIFPSRYTSTAHRSPESNLQHLDEGSPSLYSHARVPSSGSDSSFSPSFVGTRLPTPPPPPPSFPRLLHRDDTITSLSTLPSLTVDDESTPRPPDLQPGLLHFERSLLLAAQEKQRTPPELEPEEVDEQDEEPFPGSIISLETPDIKTSQLPLSPLSLTFTMASPKAESSGLPAHDSCGTPTPTHEPSCCDNGTIPSSPSLHLSEPTNGLTHAPTLRLVRPLGHGAFSAVWLAEDLSPVPLTVLSKKSVRDLRRRASGRVREKEQERWKDLGDQVKATAPEFAVDKHETKACPEPTKRTPSRLREGLRNILSFSRPLAIGSPRSSASNKSDGHPPPESSSRSIAGAGDLVNTSANSERSEISSFQSFEGPSGNSSFRNPLTSETNGSLARDSSLRKFRDRVRGTRPPFCLGRAYLDERHGEMGEMREDDSMASRYSDGARLGSEDGNSILVPSLSRNSSLNKANQRLLAVKMTPRKVRGARGRERAEEERTRVGFIREVEVLKHISHPNITPLLAHLSTVSHHILVLPYLQGGDLLGLVNNEVAWGKLGESVLRRIWCELCKAVGWMHGVGLVHRDIKLENILLTTPAFASLTPSSPRPTLSSLPAAPAPCIKLTDFGLSRFVEIDAHGEAELLSTRCGSEAYAAPELVTGGRGAYDARQTDAWACGVVLYALVGRQLPFGEGVRAQVPGLTGHKIGGERETELSPGNASVAERRQWLMRIARGEYEWPGDQSADVPTGPSGDEGNDPNGELVGPRLIHSVGARRVASRLLVRNPRKRARIGDLWDDDWMYAGEDQTWLKDSMRAATTDGEVMSPISMSMSSGDGSRDVDILSADDGHHRDQDGEWTFDEDQLDHSQRLLSIEDCGKGMDGVDQDEEEEEEEGGWLLDQEGIDNIARQEVI